MIEINSKEKIINENPNEPNEKWASIMHSIIQSKSQKSNRLEVKKKNDDVGEMEKLYTKKKVKKYPRLEPCLPGKEMDRKMARIATKGVVNLFNAVAAQKKIAEQKLSESKGLSYKEDKIINSLTVGSFLDILRNDKGKLNKKIKPKNKDKEVIDQNLILNNSDGEEDKPSWYALQKDFLINNSLSNWDKEDNLKSKQPIDKTLHDIVF